jgi:hypothetical protein
MRAKALSDKVKHMRAGSGKIESDGARRTWRAPQDSMNPGAGFHVARPPDFFMER